MSLSRSVLWVVLAGIAGVAAAETQPSMDAGRALFIGARRLEKGGAPCGACHALGGEGLAFTASLGPELSGALADLDAPAVDGLLESLPFPTMTPIYDKRPLTPAERADLATFLVAAAKQGAPQDAWRFGAWGGAIAALFFIGLALASRRRKGSSRARLLARIHLEGGSR
jgi:mono/diheme cytochrome c family protein